MDQLVWKYCQVASAPISPLLGKIGRAGLHPIAMAQQLDIELLNLPILPVAGNGAPGLQIEEEIIGLKDGYFAKFFSHANQRDEVPI